ncbi:MAG: DUF3306 domain-containing protein [Arenicellales bacterium]|jgi:hypothetical protein|nr:DUF3306 domain-containing protein [Arenicellales bacterium]
MRESQSFYARWSRRKLESKTDSDVVDHSASTERDVDEEPAVPALTDADMPALETLHDDSDYSGFLSPEVSDKLREVALRKLFHGKAFNIVDGLDDYDDDFITALPLGDIVTADMRHQAEIKLEKEKAALLEESQRVATAEESADEELKDDEYVAVDTSDWGNEDKHENQTEAVNAVSQVDDDALLESTKCSPTPS